MEYTHDLRSISKKKVQAASSVHENFTHVESSDLGFDYQCCVAWSRNGRRVVIPTEVDWLLGPVDVFGSHACFGKIYFPCEFLHLPLGWVCFVNHRYVAARRRKCFGCLILDLQVLLLLLLLLRWRQVVWLLLLWRRPRHL